MDFPSTVPGTQLQRLDQYVNEQAQAQAATSPVEHHWYDVMNHTLEGYEQAAASETTLFGSDVQNSPHAREMSSTSLSGSVDAAVDQGHELWNQLKQLTHQADDPKQNAKGFMQHLGLALGTLTTIEQGLSALLSWIPFPAIPALHVLNMGVGLPHGHPHPPNLIPPAPPIPLPSIGPIIPIPILSGAANVLINGLPAARCGDLGLGIWCGGYFPMFEIFLGSSSVWLEGARAARVGIDVTKHCILSSGVKDIPIGVPIGMTITASGNVMMGGIPMPSLTAIAMKYIFKGIGKAVKAILREIPYVGKFILCDLLRLEPIDITTGEVVLDQSDFEMKWPLPLSWKRRHRSGSRRTGHCGPGWETLADARLEFQPDGSVLFFDGQTGAAYFDWLPDAEPVNEPIAGGQLRRAGHHLTVQLKGGRCYQFTAPRLGQTEALVESISDRCGNSLTFLRDENGLRSIVSNVGPRVEVTSRGGLIESMRLQHPMEREERPLVRYAYDEHGDLCATYDALEKPHTYQYVNHGMVRHTDRNGLSFYYERDQATPEGRVVHAWGDGGLYECRITYDRVQRKTTLTNSRGHTTVIEFDERNFPIAETNPLGGITFYEYDECGRTAAVVDPGGRRTEYHYDRRGNVVKFVRPDGVAITTIFDESNRPMEVIDPNGNKWKRQWNDLSLLIEQTTPLGATTKYKYDERGQIVGVTNPRGAETKAVRDYYGNITSIVDALGNQTKLLVDALGNVLSKIDPLGHKVDYLYDKKSRLISQISPSARRTDYAYDAENNLVLHRDGEGHVTQLEYCGLGALARRIQPDGHSVTYLYDPEERLVGVKNQRGQTFQLCRDPVGRLVEEIDYWGQSKKYHYDPSGYLLHSHDELGRETKYQTDLLGRIVAKILPDGVIERFFYDGLGRLIRTENQHVQVQRKFDAVGRLLTETQGAFEIRNSYDLNGNRILRETSLGNIVSYSYDELDQVQEICINDIDVIRIERNAIGQLSKEILAPGLQRGRNYNLEGLLVEEELCVRGKMILNRKYTYDRRSELIYRHDIFNGADIFHIDPMRRIIEHSEPEGNIRKYLHDTVGDLLQPISEEAQGPGAWRRVAAYEQTLYQFDAAGNLLTKRENEAELTLDWDANNRLVRSRNWDRSETWYGYDAQGRRVFKETNGRRTDFGWDGDTCVSDVVNGNSREFIYADESLSPLAMISQSSSIVFFQNDINGAPVGVIDRDGNWLWTARYSATGGIQSLHEGSVCQPLRLQGQYFDEETRLHYNFHRYYDPAVGSFISKDPVGLYASDNLYKFKNNILQWVDLLGLECKWSWVEASEQHALDRHSPHIPAGPEGKGTLFPAEWSNQAYIEAVEKEANSPSLITKPGRGGIGEVAHVPITINGVTREVRIILGVPDSKIPGTGPGVITTAYPPK